MDIYVDTDSLGNGIDGIMRTITNVSSCVTAMKTCLSNAGADFDTINYERASDSIGIATAALNQMEMNLNDARGYLQALSDCISSYDSLRF